VRIFLIKCMLTLVDKEIQYLCILSQVFVLTRRVITKRAYISVFCLLVCHQRSKSTEQLNYLLFVNEPKSNDGENLLTSIIR